jgi:AraC family transcriptional regulator
MTQSPDPMAAARAVLPPGGGPFALPRLTLGVFLVAQPAHRLALGGDRRSLAPLAAGEGWLLPAGAEGVREFDAPLEVQTVSVDAALLAEVGLERPEAVRPVVGALDPLLAQLALGLEGFAAGGRLYADTMRRAFAAHLARAHGPPPLAAAIDDRRLRRVVEHIAAHLAEDLSLDALAAEAAMSPFHFARACKAATGLSPLQFVIRERLRAAEALLRTTRLPVAEIAWRVGYADVSRFARHFARQTGRTPAAFRAG